MVTKVTNNLYRGARIESNSQFDKLDSLNIELIINLEDDSKSIFHDELLCEVLKARFEHFSMSEFARPEVELLEKVVNCIEHNQTPIYIHCKHGQDRTGYVIAAYRMIVEKWTFGEAWYELIQMGHKWLFYFWWKKSLKKIAKKYGTK